MGAQRRCSAALNRFVDYFAERQTDFAPPWLRRFRPSENIIFLFCFVGAVIAKAFDHGVQFKSLKLQ
jgi:hypothetical protein